MNERLVASLWRNVSFGESCWQWTGKITNSGYGQIVRRKDGGVVSWLAHRLAWTLLRGPIPEGMFVLHKCDNRRCVNSDHLFVGTQADNMRDMVRKGRAKHGAEHAKSKLTEEKVREIRRLRTEGWTLRRLAAHFGVTRDAIWKVSTKSSWRHIQ